MGDAFDDWLIEKIQLLHRRSVVASGISRVKQVHSLFTALESFTKVEKIEDAEIKFTCEKCKEEVSIEKQLMLDQAPQVV